MKLPKLTKTAVADAGGTPLTDRSKALHLLVLFNFAVAQPVFDLLCGRLPFLRDLRIPASAIYALAFMLSLGLPGLLMIGVRLAGVAGRTAYRATYSTWLFLLAALFLLPALKQTGFLSASTVYGGSIVLAAGATWCYWKSPKLRSILTLSALGLPLFPLMFLLRYSASVDTTYGLSERTAKWTTPPVVLIVFDEFCGQSLMTPERELDATRFPNFAALAKDGQWFRNTASVHELTAQAVPAILSGRYGDHLWPMQLADRPQNLFSMLVGNGGYEHAAFEPVTRLAPEANVEDHSAGDLFSVRLPFFFETLGRVYLSHLIPNEHTHCLPEVPYMWFGVRLERDIDPAAHRGTFRYTWSVHRPRQFEHFLETIDGAGGPTVHFLHVLLPHVPWSYLPSGECYTKDGADWELTNLGSEADRWNPDELQVIHAQQRYLLQLMNADRLLGQVVAKLHATGQYDETLLIVTADHGISFRPSEYRRGTTATNQDEILSVPLFIKRPGETLAGANDLPVETVDIFPTIADVLGYRLTQKVDGWSVFDDRRLPRTATKQGAGGTIRSVPVKSVMTSSAPQEIRHRFGAGDDPAAIYRIGPVPELVGRNVAEFPLGKGPKLRLNVSRYGDVWPSDSAATVPCFFEGAVHRHNPVDEDPVVLAIAINGVIQAVTRTYLHAGGLSEWEAMVPKSAFHAGQNDVQIYQVTGTSPNWTLTPCEVHRQGAAAAPSSPQ